MEKYLTEEHFKDKEKFCQYPKCIKKGKWYRQNTQYIDDILNWVCLCSKHRKENDIHWQDMWNDYYSDKL